MPVLILTSRHWEAQLYWTPANIDIQLIIFYSVLVLWAVKRKCYLYVFLVCISGRAEYMSDDHFAKGFSGSVVNQQQQGLEGSPSLGLHCSAELVPSWPCSLGGVCWWVSEPFCTAVQEADQQMLRPSLMTALPGPWHSASCKSVKFSSFHFLLSKRIVLNLYLLFLNIFLSLYAQVHLPVHIWRAEEGVKSLIAGVPSVYRVPDWFCGCWGGNSSPHNYAAGTS